MCNSCSVLLITVKCDKINETQNILTVICMLQCNSIDRNICKHTIRIDQISLF